MGLSNDLISQFIKATNDKKEIKSEKTVYGTMVKHNGINYVKIDGSDLLTPVSSTTFTEDGERVTVNIKNHTAMVTGNISSPSARNVDVSDINKQISDFGTLMSYKISTEDLNAINATIENLKAKVATISGIESIDTDIENLQAEFSKLTYVDANKVEALNADIENLKIKFSGFANISAEDLEVINGYIEQLYDYTANFTYVSSDMLSAIKSDIKNADNNHANIDFTNITKNAIENFISKSGLIKNLVVGDSYVTGDLVGVTIGGISILDDSLSTMIVDENNVSKGFQLNSDGSFVSKGIYDYDICNLTIKSGILQLSSFHNPNDSNRSGAIINANGMFFKEGDPSGQTLGSIYQNLEGELYLTSEHSNIILKANGLTKIQNGLSVGKLVGGYYQSATNGGEASSGYINIAEIKLSGSYQNNLIEMEIARRGDNRPTRFCIRFANDSADPNLDIFDVFDSDMKLYIAKTGAATWNIYIPKSETYDNVAVLYAHYNGLQMGSDLITYKSEFVSSLPTGYITSDYASGFSDYQYANVYTFLSSESMIKGRSGDGGFEFYFKKDGMRIIFNGTDGKIWKVDASGTWTVLAG